MVNTRVTKVFPVGHKQGDPVFRGVQFAQYPHGDSHCSLHTLEVNDSSCFLRIFLHSECNSGGYPVGWICQYASHLFVLHINGCLPMKLTMFPVLLSGIGDPGHLSLFGIETLVDLPAVGQNLHVSPSSRHSSVVNADAARYFNRITLYSPTPGS